MVKTDIWFIRLIMITRFNGVIIGTPLFRHLAYIRLTSEANVLELSAWLDYKGD